MKSWLKWGSTRMVILFGQYAIKVPNPTEWRLFLSGLLANIQETSFSASRNPWLCPVRFSLPGGFLVIMDRCQACQKRQFDRERQWFLERAKRAGYGTDMVEDSKIDSFGIHPILGFVAVDYGS